MWSLVCIVALGLACTSKEERLASYLERAQGYFEKEQWSEAKIEFLNVLQLDPENADAHFKMGKTLWALEEYGDAIWQFKEAVRVAPDNVDFRKQLIQKLFTAHDSKGVKEQVEALLKQKPDDVDALLMRARVARVEGDPDREIEDLDRILGMHADNTAALALKAQALNQKKDPNGAEKVLRHLVKVEPTPASHLLYGAFLMADRRSKEARVELDAAIQVAKDAEERSRARLILTNFLLNGQKYDEAETQLLAARNDTPDDQKILLTLAQFYVLRGQPERAEKMLEERVAKRTADLAPLMVLSDFYRRVGKREKALETVNQALAIDPDSQEARLRKAEYLLVLDADKPDPERSATAKQLIDAVLEENPNSLLALFTQSKRMISEKKYDEAAKLLRRVTAEQPTANAHVLLGTAYVKLGQNEFARGEFLKALRLDATHYLARSQLVGLYLATGERTLAAREAKIALESRPHDIRMLLARAQALTGLGRHDAAIEVLDRIKLDEKVSRELTIAIASLYSQNGKSGHGRKLLEAIPDSFADPTVVAELARLEVREGHPEAGIERLDRAILRSPDQVDLYMNRGSILLGVRDNQGRLRWADKAEADFKKVYAKDPGRSDAHVALANLYRGTGRPDEAVEQYQKAIQIEPAQASFHLALGALFEAQEKIEPAMEEYETAIRLDPDQAIAKNNLAWLLTNKKDASDEDLDRALRLAQDAKEVLPHNPSVSDTLGWVMHRKRMSAAAISLFREAIEGYPKSPQLRALVRYHLAQTYERNGEPKRAIAELKRALAEAGKFHERADAEALLARLQSGS